jgi:hypothetical protein
VTAAPTTCGSAPTAWAWCCELAEAALDGDEDARRCLPGAIAHWLRIMRGEP